MTLGQVMIRWLRAFPGRLLGTGLMAGLLAVVAPGEPVNLLRLALETFLVCRNEAPAEDSQRDESEWPTLSAQGLRRDMRRKAGFAPVLIHAARLLPGVGSLSLQSIADRFDPSGGNGTRWNGSRIPLRC